MRFIHFRNIYVSIIVMMTIKVKDTKRNEEESSQIVLDQTCKFDDTKDSTRIGYATFTSAYGSVVLKLD